MGLSKREVAKVELGLISKQKKFSARAGTIGALAVGAVAFGALAIGALAIGRLVIGSVRIRKLEVDTLRVRRLEVIEKHAP